MTALEKYRLRLNSSGGSIRQEKINSTKRQINHVFRDDPNFYIVPVNGNRKKSVFMIHVAEATIPEINLFSSQKMAICRLLGLISFGMKGIGCLQAPMMGIRYKTLGPLVSAIILYDGSIVKALLLSVGVFSGIGQDIPANMQIGR